MRRSRHLFNWAFPLALNPLVCIIAVSCSGAIPLPGKGEIVSPSHLARYSNGGSISTVWYCGSDRHYHHFRHLFKTSTRYRVRRTDMAWPKEFPCGKKPDVLASPYLSRYYR
jgi:hypothetical protein